MRELWIAVALAGFASSCGFITAGAASAAGSEGSASNAPAGISGFGASSTKVSPALLRFVLTDAESDPLETTLFFAMPGTGALYRITKLSDTGGAPAPNPDLLATSPTGVLHEFLWRFDEEPEITGDLVAGVEVLARLGPDGTAVPAILEGVNGAIVELGNEPPEILAILAIAPPGGEVSGVVPVQFTVADSSSDAVAISAGFFDEADPGAGWRPATPSPLGSPPTFAFEDELTKPASAGGAMLTFFWNTLADLGTTDKSVRLRFTPEDEVAAGVTVESAVVDVDNNEEPIVQVLEGLLVLNPDERRGIPVPFRVIDEESDLVEVIFQWRRPGEGFPTLPSEKAALDSVLADPLLRREHRVCTPYPRFARGRVVPIDATSVRLPELGAGESWILASGLEGRALELLRPSSTPEPITPSWSANPLAGPVDVLPLGDGISALVLDSLGAGSWRLREIELASGEVVRELASSTSGNPSALAWEQGERSALVADELGGSWSIARVDLSSGALLPLFTSDPSLPVGPVRGLASLGRNTAFATAGDALLRVDWADPLAPRAVVLHDGLATPWGIIVDSLAKGRAYLAERDALTATGIGRILAIDFETFGKVPVVVKPGGGTALERPEALALERNGARLLVVASDASGERRIIALDLGGPDGNTPYAIGPSITGDVASLASGPDGLRLLARPGANELLVGGGLEQRRSIVAYEPASQRALVDAAFEPSPRPGQPWRVSAQERLVNAAPQGVESRFLWDSTDAQAGSVFLRAVPRDAEVGVAAEGSAAKPLRAPLDVDPLVLGGLSITNAPVSVAAADLDGDGDRDLVSANYHSHNLTAFFQTAPGSFDPNPLVLGGPSITDGPNSVAAADLDGDGDRDLVSANRDGNDLTVFFQTAPGSFDPNPLVLGDSSIVDLPEAVVAADLDGDGDSDLVSVNQLSNNLTIFFQIAPGSFDPDPLVLGGSSITDAPRSVAAGDLDGDGDLDLVSANVFGNGLRVFFQTAPGNFDPNPLVLGGPSGSVATADLDGDGDLDLAANVIGNGLTVFFQTAPGNFDPNPLVLGGFSGSVATADVDGDGDHDLVSTGSDTLMVVFQTASGSFDPTPLVLGGHLIIAGTTLPVATADLDGDGDCDLVSSSGDNLTVFLQSAPGGFDPNPLKLGGPSNPLTDVDFFALTAADLDGDGDRDLVSADRRNYNLTVFFQSAPGSFDRNPLVLGGPSTTVQPLSVASADLDGDGDHDFASANFSNLTVFFQSAPGSFDPAPLVLGPTKLPRSVAAADLDGDGDRDLVSANFDGDNLTVFFQKSAPGTFAQNPLKLGGPAKTKAPSFVAAADLDGDGDQDLVSANADDLTVFFQSALGSFAQNPLELGGAPTLSFPISVAAADLDGDGDLDLVSPNRLANNLQLFFQSAPGSFAPAPVLPVPGSAPYAVAAADLDGDGDQDLVSANLASSNLTVFFQSAPGTFIPDPLALGSPSAFPDFYASVAAADLDGDGDIDLVSASTGFDASFNLSNDLSVFWGRR